MVTLKSDNLGIVKDIGSAYYISISSVKYDMHISIQFITALAYPVHLLNEKTLTFALHKNNQND